MLRLFVNCLERANRIVNGTVLSTSAKRKALRHAASRVVIALLAMLMLQLPVRSSIAQEEVSLTEAVEAANDAMLRYFREVDSQRAAPLPEERRPARLTVDEVINVIKQFEPSSVGAQAASPHLRKVAEDMVLPSGARLYHHDQWWDEDRADKYEYRRFKFQLDVITGETTGYGLVIRDEPLARRLALRPSVGNVWLLGPRDIGLVRPGMHGLIPDLVWNVDIGKDDSLLVITAHSHMELGDLQAVVFDDKFRRHSLQGNGMGGLHGVQLTRFSLPASSIPSDQIRYLGFERVTCQGLRSESTKAVAEATEKGISILPFPEVGKSYEFSIATSSGRVFDSQTLRGKVVLIDFWATWCAPCMKQLPLLKEQYAEWHEAGLEVLGVSFDKRATTAVAAYDHLEVPWDLVVIPPEEDNRRLWTQATRITSLPTAILVDRHGVLRARLEGEEIDAALEHTVEMLLQE